MLPNVDPVTQGTSSGGTAYLRRADYPQLAQAEIPEATAEKAKESNASQALGKSNNADANAKAKNSIWENKDQAELNFSLTREEKEVFVNAFSKDQDPATMSEDDQETLQKAAERISKFVEEAIAKKAENRKRIEKAVSEWYDKISNGEGKGPAELIHLLHQAAMGTLGDFWDR